MADLYEATVGWTATFHGVIAAALTPFGPDGALRGDGLVEVCSFLRDNGVVAIMVGGTTGEFYAMDVHERERVLEAYVHAAQGLRIIAHVGHAAPSIVDRLADHAAGLGVDALTAITPYFLETSPTAVAAMMSRVPLRHPELPYFQYIYPAATGVSVPAQSFFHVASELRNVAGAKLSVMDAAMLRSYLAGPDHLLIVSGNDGLVADGVTRGMRALVSGNAVPFPDALSAWLSSLQRGDANAAVWSEIVARINRLGPRGPDGLRRLLAHRGIDFGYSRVSTFAEGDLNEANVEKELDEVLRAITEVQAQSAAPAHR